MGSDNLIPVLPAHPLLVVVSGPSGVGKDAALVGIKEARLPLHHVVTATTRPKRPGERDAIDYHFVSEKRFQQMVETHQFLEWAKVYGNYYGVLKKDVKEALDKGLDVIVKVDVQGAATIKRITPDAVLIFLMPPSKQELVNRLKQRHGQLDNELYSRLETAQEELECLPLFDYVIITQKDKLDVTVSEINAIVTAEKCRVQPRIIRL